jgi:hypothetical protein
MSERMGGYAVGSLIGFGICLGLGFPADRCGWGLAAALTTITVLEWFHSWALAR